MPQQLRRMLSRFSDIKTRTLLILVGIIIIVVVGVIITSSREAKPPEVAAEVKTARIGEIASLPGTGEYNEEYAKLQLAENERAAQQAQKTGEAAIPRLINPQTEEQARLSFGQEFCAECVYNEQGYDQYGYDAKGFDRSGFDANGYDANGFDKDGFDKEGYDANGFDKNGFDRNGYDKDGFDKDGYDRDGFDRNGCNREGLDRNGQPCYDALGYSAEGYNKLGYDKDGFNKDGFDKDGYDRDGFNKDGCNRQGLDRAGKPCYNKNGFNVLGYDKDGFDKHGFDKNGFDRDGFDKDGYDKDGFNRDGCNRQGLDRNGQPCNALNIPAANTQQNAEDAYRKLLEEQQKAREAQMKAQKESQDRERYMAEQQAMQQAFEALLQSQSTSLVSKWAPPTQVYVRGTHATTGEGGAGGAGSGGAATENPGTVLYKAGSIIFAVLDTSLNSDEPGPVLATIIQGPLQGSKVMGDLQLVEDKLMLRFSLLSSPDLPRSVPMDAVAIDGDTARTALATGVDNHYFLRYGSLFASSFLEGVGEAILAGITQPVVESNDSQVLVVQSATVSAAQALLVGVGTVGQKWGEHLGEIFNKKPTVTVDSGTGIGLLLTSDFVINESGGTPPPPAGTPQTAQASAGSETAPGAGMAAMTKVNEQESAQAQAR